MPMSIFRQSPRPIKRQKLGAMQTSDLSREINSTRASAAFSFPSCIASFRSKLAFWGGATRLCIICNLCQNAAHVRKVRRFDLGPRTEWVKRDEICEKNSKTKKLLADTMLNQLNRVCRVQKNGDARSEARSRAASLDFTGY